MKKLAAFVSIMMVLALMVGFLPTGSAFAMKDPGMVVLVLHNNTGGKVTFSLGDVSEQYTLQPGITKLTLDATWHTYYASLPCNVQEAGSINLNVGKELYFFCKHTKGIEMFNFSRRYVAPVFVCIFPIAPFKQGFTWECLPG